MRQVYDKYMTPPKTPKITITPFDRGIAVKVHKKVGTKKVTLRTVQRILAGQTKEDNYGVLDLALRLQKLALKRKKRTQDRFQLLKLYKH